MTSCNTAPFVVRCPQCQSDRFAPQGAGPARRVCCDACGWAESLVQHDGPPAARVERRRGAASVKARRHGNGLTARADRLRTGEWVASVQLFDGRRVVIGEYLTEKGARLAADRSAHRGCDELCEAWQPLVATGLAAARPRAGSSS